MSSSIFFDNKELKALRNLLNSLDLDNKDIKADFEGYEYEEEDDLECLTIFITEIYKSPLPMPTHPELTIIENTRIYTLDENGQAFTTSSEPNPKLLTV